MVVFPYNHNFMQTSNLTTLPFKTAKEVLEESQDNATFPSSGVMKITPSFPKTDYVYHPTTALYMLIVEGQGNLFRKDAKGNALETTALNPQSVASVAAGEYFRIEGSVVIILMSANKQPFTLMKDLE